MMSLGLAIGFGHAFESDHIAAVTTQISKKSTTTSIKQKLKTGITKSSLLGLFWGIGHTTTLMIMGFIAYYFALDLHNGVFSSFEFLVGLTLLFLGITTIVNKKIISFRHRHPHQHQDGTLHFDSHDHENHDHNHNHRSYVIGLIHGLAGSGSIVALTASTLHSIDMIFSFIVIFGLGSIIGMVLVSGLLGIPFVFSNKIPNLQKLFRYVAGGISLLLGLNIVVQIGTMNNLLGF